MTNYVIYNELFEEGRWYYGTYERERANQIACALNAINGNYCVCTLEEAVMLNVQNMPQ